MADWAAERRVLELAMRRTAAGDRSALRRVYELTSAKLFGICLRISKDRTEAEDILQDVYLSVWRRAGTYDPARGLSPITWLSAVARNCAVDRLRASKAHLARPVDDIAETADTSPLASAKVESEDESRRLRECLDELDARHAGYIRAAFFDGHTYTSLAEAAGAPLGTMKSWIRRALGRLRACLEP